MVPVRPLGIFAHHIIHRLLGNGAKDVGLDHGGRDTVYSNIPATSFASALLKQITPALVAE
jgi:hypothetical protein